MHKLNGVLNVMIIVGIVILLIISITNKDYDRPIHYAINVNENKFKPGGNYIIDKIYSEYRLIEGDLLNSTREYINLSYPKGLIQGIEVTITISMLQKENLVSRIKDPNNGKIECSGYIKVHNNFNLIEYKPYIKCGDIYKTIGYMKIYDKL